MCRNLKGLVRDQKGAVLLSAYLIISVVFVFSLAVYMRSISYFQTTERNENRMIAFNMAEAGLDFALTQLAVEDAAYADSFSRFPCASGSTYDGNGDGANEGCAVNFTSMTTGNSSVQGGYDIWVSDPVNAISTFRQIRVSGHTPVNGNATATGDCSAAASTARGYECRSVEAYVQLDNTLFEHAVFSEGDLTFNGSSTLVDSYDSALGPYGGGNVGNEGDVGNNGSVADGSISLNGNPTINGTIEENLGIECNATNAVPTVNSMGTLRVNNETSLPVVPNNVYHYNSVTVQSNNGLLHIGPTDPTDPNFGQPVTIYIDGDLEVRAGEIQAHSPVTFYVGGEVNLSGNGVTTSGNTPANLLIYATGGGDISISGGTDFYGAIFAPDSDVDTGGGINLFGGVFAANFDGNGAGAIHYDLALDDMVLPCAVVRFRAWRELDTVAGTG